MSESCEPSKSESCELSKSESREPSKSESCCHHIRGFAPHPIPECHACIIASENDVGKWVTNPNIFECKTGRHRMMIGVGHKNKACPLCYISWAATPSPTLIIGVYNHGTSSVVVKCLNCSKKFNIGLANLTRFNPGSCPAHFL